MPRWCEGWPSHKGCPQREGWPLLPIIRVQSRFERGGQGREVVGVRSRRQQVPADRLHPIRDANRVHQGVTHTRRLGSRGMKITHEALDGNHTLPLR